MFHAALAFDAMGNSNTATQEKSICIDCENESAFTYLSGISNRSLGLLAFLHVVLTPGDNVFALVTGSFIALSNKEQDGGIE
jgi:hypothetical protein